MIINLTTRAATESQRMAGVVDLPIDRQEVLNNLLTSDYKTNRNDVNTEVGIIMSLIQDLKYSPEGLSDKPGVMVEKLAPYMKPLQDALYIALSEAGYTRYTSFAQKVTMNETQPDGSKKPVTRYIHAGFIMTAPK